MRLIRLNGIVQGVGFRPFVYRTAVALGIRGTVLNSSSGVSVEAEGPDGVLDEFIKRLKTSAPPAARIEKMTVETLSDKGFSGFVIISSDSAEGEGTLVSPDLATCSDCLLEMADPDYFRHRYPFINCTNCGPRFSIIEDLPYDRPATSMRWFSMCAACAAEYVDPIDRRFHAQPVACPECGPRLTLLGPDLVPVATAVPSNEEMTRSINAERQLPLDMARDALLGGAIVAVKGIGGFHLACRADREESVTELRRRKLRPHKPFAVMCLPSRVQDIVCAGPGDLAVLSSPAAPILILPRRTEGMGEDFPGHCPELDHGNQPLTGVAPFNPGIGVFFPYAPVHHLLLCREMPFLIMTSGNRGGEPIAVDPLDLAGLADLYLDHDRPIINRCDDSVLMPALPKLTKFMKGAMMHGSGKAVVEGSVESGNAISVPRGPGERYLVVRRSRGLVPEPMPLPMEIVPVLGCGAEMKLSFSLASGRTMFTSPYIGENSFLSTMEFYEATLNRFRRWFRIEPAVVACDLQPDFGTTRFARELASQLSIPLVGVQHHHAHTAAVMAENGLTGRVIGISLDGTGMGTDGTIWGGEVISAGYDGFDRLFGLEPMPLPGGDAAIRHPARIALAYLVEAGVDPGWLKGLSETERRVVARQTVSGLNVFRTSSAGRLFDCAAAMLGLFSTITFEAQAAMAMEFLCVPNPSGKPEKQHGPRNHSGPADRARPYRYEIEGSRLAVKPLVRDMAADIRKGTPPFRVSARFHKTVACMFVDAAVRAGEATGLHRVALSGGCLQNRILALLLEKGLTAAGFEVYNGRSLPYNDGAVSAGQAAIAGFLRQ